MVDKVGNYAKYVKEMYWPKVSDKKKHELEEIKKGMKREKMRKSMGNKMGDLLSEEADDDDDDSVIRENHRLLSNEGTSSMPNLHQKPKFTQRCKLIFPLSLCLQRLK